MVAAGMTDIESYGDDILSSIEKVWINAKITVSRQCTFYNGFLHEWDNNKRQCMKDMIYLFNLLEKGKIKPKVATKIPLMNVAAVQERLDQDLESMERRGVVVVDPWLLSDSDY